MLFPVFCNGINICGASGAADSAAAQICRGKSQRKACMHSIEVVLHENRAARAGARDRDKNTDNDRADRYAGGSRAMLKIKRPYRAGLFCFGTCKAGPMSIPLGVPLLRELRLRFSIFLIVRGNLLLCEHVHARYAHTHTQANEIYGVYSQCSHAEDAPPQLQQICKHHTNTHSLDAALTHA